MPYTGQHRSRQCTAGPTALRQRPAVEDSTPMVRALPLHDLYCEAQSEQQDQNASRLDKMSVLIKSWEDSVQTPRGSCHTEESHTHQMMSSFSSECHKATSLQILQRGADGSISGQRLRRQLHGGRSHGVVRCVEESGISISSYYKD